MKIVIHDCRDLDHSSQEALLSLFPTNLNGKLLNYGQGEGQIKIGEMIWGLYYGKNESLLLQFEEGVVSWSTLQEFVTKMTECFSQKTGRKLMVTCEGSIGDDRAA